MSNHPQPRSSHEPLLPPPSPIRSPLDALRLCSAAGDVTNGSTTGNDTVVIALDDQQCALGLIRVTDTIDPDALLVVLDIVAEAARGQPGVAAVVVASIRRHGGLDIDDLDRWRRADQSCDDAGLELIEWFVIGQTVSLPREWCGEPARWPP